MTPERSWWAGDPTFREHPLRWIAWLLDEALDCIPAASIRERHFYLKGGWGCRLHLHRFWTPDAEWDC